VIGDVAVSLDITSFLFPNCQRDRAMSKKKSKVAMADGIPIKPISPAEHKRLEKRIKQKHEKLRKRYREVYGKKVDWISHWMEEGILFFTVRFTDGKGFSVTYSPALTLDIVEFLDMSSGDDVILKNYYQREDL
jgi:hypothetical protein